MYFVLSKTIGTLFLPSNVLMLLGVVGVVFLLIRRSLWGLRLLIGSFLALVVCAVSPLGYALLLPLETRFPVWIPTGEPYGIIVLGGGVRIDVSAARNEPIAGFGVDRILYAAKLARDFPRMKIIYSGGSSNIQDDDAREADYAVRLFEYLGVPASRVIIERSARNTIENAVFVRSLRASETAEHWLLVTSAFHMPRAVGLFREVGIDIVPVPVGWLTGGGDDLFRLATGFEGLFRVNVAAREWMGLFVSRISGRTKAFLPAP